MKRIRGRILRGSSPDDLITLMGPGQSGPMLLKTKGVNGWSGSKNGDLMTPDYWKWAIGKHSGQDIVSSIKES